MSGFVPNGNQSIKKMEVNENLIPSPQGGEDHHEGVDQSVPENTGTLKQFLGWSSPADEFRVDV